MEGDSRLKLSHITSSENGMYSCRAENIAGARDSMENFLLNIKGMNCVRILITARIIDYSMFLEMLFYSSLELAFYHYF